MSLNMHPIRMRIKKHVPLGPFTTFHIGGPAEMFFEATNENDLVEIIAWARREKIPYFILGGGSNLVISDSGIPGLVIRNVASNADVIDIRNAKITVSTGRPLAYLVGLAYHQGFTGLETLAGIPGSIGGAIYGNAGAYGKCIGDLLEQAEVLTPEGKILQVDNKFFEFGYRTSQLKKSEHIVLNATFRLAPGNMELIHAQMADIIRQRHSKHPSYEIGSAGSFFKNLDPNPGESRRRAAGEVLEKAGAKNMSVGGACVYEKHANFIVNYGRATAADVKALALKMKNAVLQMFGIELHEEVVYVGQI